jgi:hypothetical protein
VDLISCLATQKTYEGLISEIFTIANSHCDLDSEMVAVGEDRNKKLPPKVKYERFCVFVLCLTDAEGFRSILMMIRFEICEICPFRMLEEPCNQR